LGTLIFNGAAMAIPLMNEAGALNDLDFGLELLMT
jgi:hypothetical protein